MAIDWGSFKREEVEESVMFDMVPPPTVEEKQQPSQVDWASFSLINEEKDEDDGARMVDSLETDSEFDVDFAFLRKVEGFETAGYVPTSKGKVLGQSGVTVGSGVDLGHQSEDTLIRAGVPQELVSKVKPYLGLRKQSALDKLRQESLQLSQDEAEAITVAMKQKTLRDIASRFDRDSEGMFSELDPAWQTVVASVAYQYGTNLKRRTPNFWKQVTSGDLEGALKNLRNFGDDYKTRRNQEADLVEGKV